MKIKEQTILNENQRANYSKHSFEVVDETDEVSSKHGFEVADKTDESAQNMVLGLQIETDVV
ncbi:hypothetical protein [Streptococcus pneumoniae]|uniref:hypothetical protein n=1 Tax=Streptococcus pneumoniae TaxID=1313 RepID=UPI00126397FC|nr:hypothetical protein [Streptococcus pneumoniae]